MDLTKRPEQLANKARSAELARILSKVVAEYGEKEWNEMFLAHLVSLSSMIAVNLSKHEATIDQELEETRQALSIRVNSMISGLGRAALTETKEEKK